uniref:Large ribosomal subunit protein eL22 n=1 Tax=Gallus gallus TaxID=9031 RepID=A0A8V0ZGE5_CHICK
MAPVKKPAAKGGKKKKQVLKFTLDCTHPVEDGIMDAANFEQFLAGADQSEWEGWKPGWWRGDHREEQEQDHCYFRGALLQEVPEVPDQEVPEEEQSPRLAARGGQQQGELRAALLPDQPGRGGGGGGGLKRTRRWKRFVHFPE